MFSVHLQFSEFDCDKNLPRFVEEMLILLGGDEFITDDGCPKRLALGRETVSSLESGSRLGR